MTPVFTGREDDCQKMTAASTARERGSWCTELYRYILVIKSTTVGVVKTSVWMTDLILGQAWPHELNSLSIDTSSKTDNLHNQRTNSHVSLQT